MGVSHGSHGSCSHGLHVFTNKLPQCLPLLALHGPGVLRTWRLSPACRHDCGRDCPTQYTVPSRPTPVLQIGT